MLPLLGVCVAGILSIIYLESHLPPVGLLKDIRLQTPLRIYSSDKKLIAEFGEKKRIPVTLSQVPQHLIHAVISTEDNRFYDHPGVDLWGIARAAFEVFTRGEKTQGGSTITMQVARNFFLSREKTYTRKISEILLALKIEDELTKDQILTLYLNKIFFGHRAYGVAAAAQAYFGKTLGTLTLAESALLAGLPQAPSSINPLSNLDAATKRRAHVLSRMLYYNYITQAEFDQAIREPIQTHPTETPTELQAPYVAETIRNALVKYWGSNVYTEGIEVYTTINSHLQTAANHTVRTSLLEYEQRHGYRGPEANWAATDQTPIEQQIPEWKTKLHNWPRSPLLIAAVVTAIHPQAMTVLTADGTTQNIEWPELRWAYRISPTQGEPIGSAPQHPGQVAQIGDVVRIWYQETKQRWSLSQIPQIEGALIALEPESGKMLAMVGGYDFQKSNFNRATQALRQAGSSLKPFVYSAALAKGYTAASVFNDAPIVIHDVEQEALWRPQNSTQQFYGPTRLRTALVNSRNLVSIRVLQAIGIDYAQAYLQRFGFTKDQLPHSLSLALGTASVTPLQIAQAFSVFANGGVALTPQLIDHIENQNKTIYTATTANSQPHTVISPQNAYIITDMLHDALQNGTGKRARILNRPDLSGKTGTSHDNFDAWYSGYNTKLMLTTWMGYDQPRSLREYAASSALPMWIAFMKEALKEIPESPMAMPPDIVHLPIDPETGLLNQNNPKNSIMEIFETQALPSASSGQASILVNAEPDFDTMDPELQSMMANPDAEDTSISLDNEAPDPDADLDPDGDLAPVQKSVPQRKRSAQKTITPEQIF
jgi:penicillin-binding protein 1A